MEEYGIEKNCKKIIFMSNTGYDSMAGNYGKIKDKEIIEKSEIIYPAFSSIPSFQKKENDKLNILFSTESFYGDCGEQIINSFLKLEKLYDIQLIIFSPNLIIPYPKTITYNSFCHKKIMHQIKTNKDIICNPKIGINTFLKKTDIYIRPPIKDHYAFDLVKIMRYGLPIISSDFFAIPEIIEDNKEGFLIDLDDRYYVLKEIKNQTYLSKKLQEHVENQIYSKLKTLIENRNLRNRFGKNARKKAINNFSYKARNKIMKKVYDEAVI